jgi:DNA-binding response OmpR family regulator
VLLDVMVPKIDGFELLRRIRAAPRTKHLPVIMVTSLSRDKDAARGRSLGANDYIVKPLMEFDFLKRVEHVIQDQ